MRYFWGSIVGGTVLLFGLAVLTGGEPELPSDHGRSDYQLGVEAHQKLAGRLSSDRYSDTNVALCRSMEIGLPTDSFLAGCLGVK
jgi:hypothetical protein